MAGKTLNKLKILVVDDSADQIEIIEQQLEMSGLEFELHSEGSGERGLAYMQGLSGGYPDIIILDISLPGINGLEVLKQLKSHASWHVIPAIVLSVSEDLQDVVKTYKLGGTFFMKKPFDQKAFKEIVNQLRVTGRINISRP